MEKPTGLIAKVIDTLHVVNSIETPYSLIEKDIVLQHIRAAYLQLLNIPTSDELTREALILPDLATTAPSPIEDPKLKEEVIHLKDEVLHLTEQLTSQKNIISHLETSLTSEKQKQTSLEHHLTELNNSNQAQKTELEALLTELDEKDQMIIHLKQELEMVLLREDELEHELPVIIPAPVIEKPIEPVVIPAPVVEKPIEPVVIPVPVVEKPIEPVVIPAPVVDTAPIKPIEPTIEEVDDILEFTHPTPVKQEQHKPTVTPQPLLFVEEKEVSKQEKKSLNDLLTEKKEDNSIGSRFQQAKIQDLTKAISINDKFLFIRELFRSKGEEFSTAIHKLNNCSNIEEAFNVMEELKNFYFWDTTTSAYLSLCDLVRRKFL
jgi:hypothetical protein